MTCSSFRAGHFLRAGLFYILAGQPNPSTPPVYHTTHSRASQEGNYYKSVKFLLQIHYRCITILLTPWKPYPITLPVCGLARLTTQAASWSYKLESCDRPAGEARSWKAVSWDRPARNIRRRPAGTYKLAQASWEQAEIPSLPRDYTTEFFKCIFVHKLGLLRSRHRFSACEKLRYPAYHREQHDPPQAVFPSS